MTGEDEFYATIGRLTRRQGWTLGEVAMLALAHVARTKAQREGFLRTLKRLAVQQDAAPTD